MPSREERTSFMKNFSSTKTKCMSAFAAESKSQVSRYLETHMDAINVKDHKRTFYFPFLFSFLVFIF